MPNRLSLAALLLLVAALPAWAKSGFRVEAQQGAAWIERSGIPAPLPAGLELEAGDFLYTGQDARIEVSFPDGSRLQLGENADARLEGYRVAEARTLVTITRGAYRLSTTTPVNGRRRDIQLKTRALAIDIHHADMWGNAGENSDTVCLREGRIIVVRDNKLRSLEEAPVCLDGTITQEEAEQQLRQTELISGHGTNRADGAWKVNVQSLAKRDGLAKMLAQLHAAGYPAEIIKVRVKQQNFFRLRIAGFASKSDALYVAERLKKENRAGEPWVSQE